MDGDRLGAGRTRPDRPRRRLRSRLGARPETLPFLHLVPNLVTIVGLCSGLTALRFGFAGGFEPAVALVIFAAVIDGLDGLLARRLNVASRFGGELDSLSDFVCFGVVPAMLLYQMTLAGAADFAWTAALVFAVCACLRLARFNVNRDAPVVGTAHFVGVPAPAGALLVLLPAYISFAGIADAGAFPWLVAPWLVAVGALMISRIRTFAPKGLRIQRRSARWLLVGAALVVGLGISNFWLVMILLSGVYLATLAYALVAARRMPPRPVDAGD
jgi:CDP-diacylglycerol--serine O-phosphatidyltransferase